MSELHKGFVHSVRALLAFWLILGSATALKADRVTVAVAANFVETLEQLQPLFEKSNDHEMRIVVGSTGKLYAQILNGAPFDVFLSADQERPRLLSEAGLAVPSTQFTYAIGKLILWSADPARSLSDGARVLAAKDYRKLALPNPQLAPYGAAAQQVLEKLGLWQDLQNRIVTGENVGQTFGFVASGNAEIGFVSLSSYLSLGNQKKGVFWAPSPQNYAPIRQDAVILEPSEQNPAARAFMAFLQGRDAEPVLERFGYMVDDR